MTVCVHRRQPVGRIRVVQADQFQLTAFLVLVLNLPAFPVRDREYLRVKDSNWYHETAGMQYSQSTKVRQAGIRWLAEQLGLELPAIPADNRDVA